MMWDKKDCPLCGKEMIVFQGVDTEPIYLLRCPTPMDIPDNLLLMMRATYAADSIATHFEVEYLNHKPDYQSLRIYPYAVKSYDDISNIYMYDERLHLRFIVETPHIDLPWNNVDKIIKKLSTYTLFS